MTLLAMAISVVVITGCTSSPANDAPSAPSESQSPQAKSSPPESQSTPPTGAKTSKPAKKANDAPKHTVQAGKNEARFGEALVFPNKIAVTVEFVKYFEISDDGFAMGAEPGDDAGLFKVSLYNGSNADFDGSVAGISAIDYGSGLSTEIVFDEAAGAKGASFGIVKPGETAEILDGRILPKTQQEISIEVFGDSPGTDHPLAKGTVVDRP